MRIAVATEDGKSIFPHFGRSPYFIIFEVEQGRIITEAMRQNTFTGHFRGKHEHHHGAGDPHLHQSVAEGLKDCQVVISQGMGRKRKAWMDLRARGIEMIVTNEVEVKKAVRMYLAGELVDQIDKLH